MRPSNKKIGRLVLALLMTLVLCWNVVGARNVNALTQIDVTSYYDQTPESLLRLKQKYQIEFDYDQPIFKEGLEPVINDEQVVGGILKDEVIADTLRQLNYFRELYGLRPVSELNDDAMENSGHWAAAQAAAGTIAHDVDRLEGEHPVLTTEFLTPISFRQSPNSYLENVSMEATNINKLYNDFLVNSVGGWIDDLYSNNDIGHRMTILDPKVTSWSMGVAINTLNLNDKSFNAAYSVLRSHRSGEKEAEDVVPDLASYPTPGIFPSEAFILREINAEDVETAQWHFELKEGHRAIDPQVEIIIDDEVVQTVKPIKYWDRMIYQYQPADEVIEKIAIKDKDIYRGKQGASYDVRISGFENESGDSVIYRYTTWFDYKRDVDPSDQPQDVTNHLSTESGRKETGTVKGEEGRQNTEASDSDVITSTTTMPTPSTVNEISRSTAKVVSLLEQQLTNQDIKQDDSTEITELNDRGTGILVYGKGLAGYTLIVKEMSDLDPYSVLLNENQTIHALYDIHLEKEGVETLPPGTVEVRLPLIDDLDQLDFEVNHLTTDNRQVIDHQIKNGYIVFESDHFSCFAVISKPMTALKNTDSDQQTTFAEMKESTAKESLESDEQPTQKLIVPSPRKIMLSADEEGGLHKPVSPSKQAVKVMPRTGETILYSVLALTALTIAVLAVGFLVKRNRKSTTESTEQTNDDLDDFAGNDIDKSNKKK